MRTSRKVSLIALCVGIILVSAVWASAQGAVEFGFRGGLNVANQSDENTAFRPWDHDILSDPLYADDYSTASITWFEIGCFFNYEVSPSFSIQPELKYTRKGVNVTGLGTFEDSYDGDDLAAEYDVLVDKIELTYIEVPVLLKFKLPAKGNFRPSIFAGPAMAFNIGQSREMDVEYTVFVDGYPVDGFIRGEPEITNLKSTDMGLVFGGEIRIPYGSINLSLDARYTMGMTDVFEDINAEDVGLLINARPEELPVADFYTGEASGVKNRSLSITLGVSMAL